jgi:hypothetical protein
MKIVTRTRPSTTTKAPVDSIGSQLVMRAGETLKSRSAKPIAMPNAKMSWPRESSLEYGLPSDGRAHACQSSLLVAATGSGLLEAALEPLHPSARVHELLLARVERVAFGADLDMKVRLRGARLKLVAAGAANGREDIVGVDVGLHRPREDFA